VCVCVNTVATDVEEELGNANGGIVHSLYDYTARNSDELSFRAGEKILILHKGDEEERDWWWASVQQKEGYIPRNYIGVSDYLSYYVLHCLCKLLYLSGSINNCFFKVEMEP